MYLVISIILSMALHFVILYVPFFTSLFSITPLNTEEWYWVLLISAPVIIVDELLKFVSRNFIKASSADAFYHEQQDEKKGGKTSKRKAATKKKQ